MEIVEGLGAKKSWPTVFTRLHGFSWGEPGFECGATLNPKPETLSPGLRLAACASASADFKLGAWCRPLRRAGGRSGFHLWVVEGVQGEGRHAVSFFFLRV